MSIIIILPFDLVDHIVVSAPLIAHFYELWWAFKDLPIYFFLSVSELEPLEIERLQNSVFFLMGQSWYIKGMLLFKQLIINKIVPNYSSLDDVLHSANQSEGPRLF